MAMIEVQDLQAPFRSRTHIISMTLAIGMFAVFRVVGGGMNLSMTPNRPIDAKTTTSSEKPPLSWDEDEEELPTSRAAVVAAKPSGRSRLIDDELSPFDGVVAPSREDEQVDAFEDESKGGFDDIERELGLQ
jgi:hypothetical protein